MEAFRSFWVHGLMPLQLLALLSLTFLAFVIINYFFKRIGKGISPFWQAILIWFTALFILKYIISPPLPSSLLYQYMVVIATAVFVLVSATEASWTAFKRPILAVLVAETGKYKIARVLLFIALPILALVYTYNFMIPVYEEPIELRTDHPSPPQSFIVYGRPFFVGNAQYHKMELNPFRVDDTGLYSKTIQQQYINGNPWEPNQPLYLQYVREGGEIFFENCHFCHGANLNGKGMFAFAFNPFPANLMDAGTIAQLQESRAFWRVATGGPGLPREAFPWASAMPPWEQHLKKEEIWKVILFEYWYTGYDPPVVKID